MSSVRISRPISDQSAEAGLLGAIVLHASWMGPTDCVLIVDFVGIERFEQQASERVESLADDLDHLVSSRGMLVLRSGF